MFKFTDLAAAVPVSLRNVPSNAFLTLQRTDIVKIISNLCPRDIYSCRGSCRRLNRLIIDSPIIQYTIRTTLSGVSDPLDPDIPLSDHLDAFNQWEAAWREIDLRKPNASIDEPVLAENDPDIEYSIGRYFVLSREGYGISGSGYAFLDLHSRSLSSHTNATRWKTIKVKAYNLMLAFAPELDVAVAIEYVRQLVPSPPFPSPLFHLQLCSIRIA